jgi:hypothetical protein
MQNEIWYAPTPRECTVPHLCVDPVEVLPEWVHDLGELAKLIVELVLKHDAHHLSPEDAAGPKLGDDHGHGRRIDAGKMLHQACAAHSRIRNGTTQG